MAEDPKGFGDRRVCARYGFAALAALALSSGAMATTLEYSVSIEADSGHAASAKFTADQSDQTVSIRISNIMDEAYDSADSRALTGLFFDSNRDFTWNAVEVVESGTGDMVGSGDFNTPIEYWAYRDELSTDDTPFGTQYGLGAAGMGVFNHQDILSGNGSPPLPNGINGGILSPTAETYNNQNQTPMWRESIEFRFFMDESFFADGLDGIEFSKVRFQFGSGFNEPSLVPLPAPVLMGAAGLAGVVAIRRRRSAA